jgi:NAD(P)H-hydrate repair Nnr-like enzyme with NAD(P)H-hydrate epimerase domain
MRAARLAVAAEERIVCGINENEGDGMIFAKVLQQRRKLFQLHAFAGIHEEGSTSKIAFAGSVQLGKNRNQLNRKIIDAIEAHVLESVEDSAFSRA